MSDPVAAALQEKREAIAEAASIPEPDLTVMTWRAGLAAGTGSALLAAVEAVLELAGEWDQKGRALIEQIAAENADGARAGFMMCTAQAHLSCAKKVRAALATALVGEGKPDA